MPTYRTFRNFDPPALAEIWRSQAGQPGVMQPVSVDLFEQFIFGKLYFDCEGLTLAFDDERPVGFAHAAFGPNAAHDGIATDSGTTCLVMVRPDCARGEVAEGLLARCEAYLRRRGAKVLYGGAARPLDPFYTGLYGGSGLPGVLDSDTVARDLYRSQGYDPVDRTVLLRRWLDEFRPLVDRRQVQFRRRMSVEMKMDPPARSWWEACTTGDFDLSRFELTERGGDRVLASATYRGMEPTSGSGPGRVVGLLDLEVDSEYRRQGFATFLLGESLRQYARRGVAGVEALVIEANRSGVGLFEKLGLEQVEQGTVFRKKVP